MDEWEKTFSLLDSSHAKKDEYIKRLEAATKEKDAYINQLENQILLLEAPPKEVTHKKPAVKQISWTKPSQMSPEEKKRIMDKYYFTNIPLKKFVGISLTSSRTYPSMMDSDSD
jgi:hypothetical protein